MAGVGASSDVVICILYDGHAQAPHLSEDSLCMSEAAVMMSLDTKKDAHTTWKYTIMSDAMSIRLVERGASEGCRPQLPRWPFSGSRGTRAPDTPLDKSMVREPRAESQPFCAVYAWPALLLPLCLHYGLLPEGFLEKTRNFVRERASGSPMSPALSCTSALTTC